MWLKSLLRSLLNVFLTETSGYTLINQVPTLKDHLEEIDEFGLYLHIPFCRQICPYCPYNKVLYDVSTAKDYADAVIREIDRYAKLTEGKTVTSFYIGGGTPTTMLFSGLERILDHIRRSFHLECELHMESHPNDLSEQALDKIEAMGIQNLSIGVEALQDHHLQTLHRPYTTELVQKAVRRTVARSFTCVNADFIFALPKQTYEEVAQAGSLLVDMGVDQIAAYPLFRFPYTQWNDIVRKRKYRNIGLLKKRKMLAILEKIFIEAGYQRTSVWAFTRQGIPKYCSVTIPLYIGLGASAGSYLRDILYFNTFNVNEYIQALRTNRSPIALSLELSKPMQMAGWLYWRIYETAFFRHDFELRFGERFDQVYGWIMLLLNIFGFLKEKGERIVLSGRGAYWLHVLQDLFSIDYISKLWGTSGQDPWPKRVSL